eukprot:scaffold835_cov202-Alexandrium_tamarense.AAC.15
MESESMLLVKTEYSKLQDAISDLGDTIQSSLERQKEVTQRAHNTDLQRLQVERESLKLEKSRLEESIANNERANLLENERDWYKKEALHLDKVLEQTKSRQNELMGELVESVQDRKWMKAQMEKITKHLWTMESKLKELGVDASELITEGLKAVDVKEEKVTKESRFVCDGDKVSRGEVGGEAL